MRFFLLLTFIALCSAASAQQPQAKPSGPRDFDFEFAPEATFFAKITRQDSLGNWKTDTLGAATPCQVAKAGSVLRIFNPNDRTEVLYLTGVRYAGLSLEHAQSLVYAGASGETIYVNPALGFVVIVQRKCQSATASQCDVTVFYFGKIPPEIKL